MRRLGAVAALAVLAAACAIPGDPIALDDAYTVAPGETIDLAVTRNDFLPVGAAVAMDLVAAPAQGEATVSGTTVRFTAPASFAETSFRYRVDAGTGTPAEATVTISSDLVLRASPEAVEVQAGRQAEIVVSAGGIEPAELELAASSATELGTASVAAPGIVVYAAGDAPGSDEVQITGRDSRGRTAGVFVPVVITQPDELVLRAVPPEFEVPVGQAVEIEISAADVAPRDLELTPDSPTGLGRVGVPAFGVVRYEAGNQPGGAELVVRARDPLGREAEIVIPIQVTSGELAIRRPERVVTVLGSVVSFDVELANVGSAPLDVEAVTVEGRGGLVLGGHDCRRLEPERSCTAQVRFAPDRVGDFTAAVVAAYDAGTGTLKAEAPLAAGAEPALVASPGFVDLGISAPAVLSLPGEDEDFVALEDFFLGGFDFGLLAAVVVFPDVDELTAGYEALGLPFVVYELENRAEFPVSRPESWIGFDPAPGPAPAFAPGEIRLRDDCEFPLDPGGRCRLFAGLTPTEQGRREAALLLSHTVESDRPLDAVTAVGLVAEVIRPPVITGLPEADATAVRLFQDPEPGDGYQYRLFAPVQSVRDVVLWNDSPETVDLDGVDPDDCPDQLEPGEWCVYGVFTADAGDEAFFTATGPGLPAVEVHVIPE